MTREEAREELKEEFEIFRNGIGLTDWENPNEELKKIIEANTMAIKALEQEPKVGHWIEVIDEIDSFGSTTWHHECSICGNAHSGWGEYKYCPNCGAKMESEG